LRFTVVLIPDQEWISATVPAMPGCASQGRTRDEALAHVREGIRGWLITEAQQGRTPLMETPALVSAGVSEALEIIDEMRRSGEVAADQGYDLEVTTVEIREPAIA
jgi:predicted RNase H-like HicB family nuclease